MENQNKPQEPWHEVAKVVSIAIITLGLAIIAVITYETGNPIRTLPRMPDEPNFSDNKAEALDQPKAFAVEGEVVGGFRSGYNLGFVPLKGKHFYYRLKGEVINATSNVMETAFAEIELIFMKYDKPDVVLELNCHNFVPCKNINWQLDNGNGWNSQTKMEFELNSEPIEASVMNQEFDLVDVVIRIRGKDVFGDEHETEVYRRNINAEYKAIGGKVVQQ